MTLVSFNLHKESPLPSLGEKAKQIQNFSFVFFAICLRQRALVSGMWLPCSASSLVRTAQHSLRLGTSLSARIVHTPSAYRVSRVFCWSADCLGNYKVFLVVVSSAFSYSVRGTLFLSFLLQSQKKLTSFYLVLDELRRSYATPSAGMENPI